MTALYESCRRRSVGLYKVVLATHELLGTPAGRSAVISGMVGSRGENSLTLTTDNSFLVAWWDNGFPQETLTEFHVRRIPLGDGGWVGTIPTNRFTRYGDARDEGYIISLEMVDVRDPSGNPTGLGVVRLEDMPNINRDDWWALSQYHIFLCESLGLDIL